MMDLALLSALDAAWRGCGVQTGREEDDARDMKSCDQLPSTIPPSKSSVPTTSPRQRNVLQIQQPFPASPSSAAFLRILQVSRPKIYAASCKPRPQHQVTVLTAQSAPLPQRNQETVKHTVSGTPSSCSGSWDSENESHSRDLESAVSAVRALFASWDGEVCGVWKFGEGWRLQNASLHLP